MLQNIETKQFGKLPCAQGWGELRSHELRLQANQQVSELVLEYKLGSMTHRVTLKKDTDELSFFHVHDSGFHDYIVSGKLKQIELTPNEDEPSGFRVSQLAYSTEFKGYGVLLIDGGLFAPIQHFDFSRELSEESSKEVFESLKHWGF